MVDVPEIVKVVGLDIKYDLIFRIKGKKAVDILTCFGYEVAAGSDPYISAYAGKISTHKYRGIFFSIVIYS